MGETWFFSCIPSDFVCKDSFHPFYTLFFVSRSGHKCVYTTIWIINLLPLKIEVRLFFVNISLMYWASILSIFSLSVMLQNVYIERMWKWKVRNFLVYDLFLSLFLIVLLSALYFTLSVCLSMTFCFLVCTFSYFPCYFLFPYLFSWFHTASLLLDVLILATYALFVFF